MRHHQKSGKPRTSQQSSSLVWAHWASVSVPAAWGICPLVQPQAWCFKWSIASWMLVRVPVGREDFLGTTCLYKAYLSCLIQPPVPLHPTAFLMESSPHWPFAYLNFSLTTFFGGGGVGSQRQVHLFTFALLLIYAMQQTTSMFNGLKRLTFLPYGFVDQEFLQSPSRRLFCILWQQLRSVGGFSWQRGDLEYSRQLHSCLVPWWGWLEGVLR